MSPLCAECSISFIKNRSNQKYCSLECCKFANNKKILERYNRNKTVHTLIRKCQQCSKKLSRYNKGVLCFSCDKAREDEIKIDFLKSLGFEYIDE